MKKISILITLILILGFANQSFAFVTACGHFYKTSKAYKKSKYYFKVDVRDKAFNILGNYCQKHNNCSVSYYKKCVNGYCTYSGSSFLIVGNPVIRVKGKAGLCHPKWGNFIITQSLFSTQLQHQLVFTLKQNGYSNASQINLTTAFVSYITPNKTIFTTVQALNGMASSGDLKDFNELVNLYIKYFIRMNK